MSHMTQELSRLIDFLNTIGLPCRVVNSIRGFVNGVRIVGGELLICPEACPSDVLHEAGHLAVLPGRFRRLANDDLAVVHTLMLTTVDFSDPDRGESRAALQSGDAEATAWAWAAGEHLGVPANEIIRDADYGGEGSEIRFALQVRAYLGIHGLAAAGFCAVRAGGLARARALPAYPKLAMWLQHDFQADSVMPLLADT